MLGNLKTNRLVDKIIAILPMISGLMTHSVSSAIFFFFESNLYTQFRRIKSKGLCKCEICKKWFLRVVSRCPHFTARHSKRKRGHKHRPIFTVIIIRCIFDCLSICREPTTWPANNCLQIMVCSCVVPQLILQLIFCSCAIGSTFSREKMAERFPELPESD